MRLIILINKYGNHCNRLFQALHYHAYCLEEKALFINISSIGILKFDNKFYKIIDKFMNFSFSLFSKLYRRVNKNNCKLISKNKFIQIVEGWDFRVNSLTNKHHCKLSEIYNFKKKYYSKKSVKIKNYLNILHKNNKYLVGLHIRRGDYKTWQEGKYYFDDSFYNRVIGKLKKDLRLEGKDPFFVVVSDELISHKINFDYKTCGSWRDDQITLQNCDLLVGPPSTFSMWASYISQIPLITLNNINKIELDNKSICFG